MNQLFICGLGYCGGAIGRAAEAAGFAVSGTTRSGRDGTIAFGAAGGSVRSATHLLTTAAPEAGSDPVLARYAADIAAAVDLRWIGYLSSTAVYGDRGGGWVDEDTPAKASQERGQRRLEAEEAWSAFADRCAVDIFRLGGIYGPGRSAFDDLRSGRARRMVKPGHQFGRIHRDDIAQAVVAAMRQDRPFGRRVLNLVDDMPSESALVVNEAATLLDVPPPPEVAFADAQSAMSPMARSFWGRTARSPARRPARRWGLPGCIRVTARAYAPSWPRSAASVCPSSIRSVGRDSR